MIEIKTCTELGYSGGSMTGSHGKHVYVDYNGYHRNGVHDGPWMLEKMIAIVVDIDVLSPAEVLIRMVLPMTSMKR